MKAKATILTRNGHYFDILSPDPALVFIHDIAHALSNVCRFTGHVREFYSVAEHSVRVASLVPPELRMAALLHDAAEAYVGDMSAPLKAALPEYREIEDKVAAAIAEKFDVAPDAMRAPEIRRADLILLASEREGLMFKAGGPQRDEEWATLGGVEVDPDHIIARPWTPHKAAHVFLSAFRMYEEAPA